MSDVLIRYLTLVGLTSGTLALVWGFGRKLFKYLSPLTALPEMRDSLERLERSIRTVQEKVEQSDNWHQDHLDREHRRRF